MMMELSIKSCSHENPKADAVVEESMRFDKFLEELRELRSQLHQAADYCETKFSNSQEKNVVVENTKEYICKTMVTVVDHLGNVSANLEGLISHKNAFSEAELRIQCLQQRILLCERYARKCALTNMQWSEMPHRFHLRYLSPTPLLERSSSKKVIRYPFIHSRLMGTKDSESQVQLKVEDNHVQETHEDLTLFMQTHNYKPPVQNLKPITATLHGHNNLAIVVPVQDRLSFLTKAPNPTFQFQRNKTVGRHRRSLYGSDILWFIRRNKTNPMKN